LGKLDRFNQDRASVKTASAKVFPSDREPYTKIAAIMELADTLVQYRKDAAERRKLLEDTTTKSASMFQSFLQAGIGAGAERVLRPQDLSKELEGQKVDPQQKILASIEEGPGQEFKSMQVQEMLADFINNDKVLSQMSPSTVVSAYNEIARQYPRLSGNKVIMRQLLQRKIQQSGGLDPYESSQLLDQEKTLQGMEAVRPSGPKEPKP
jgi:hypothetical protein